MITTIRDIRAIGLLLIALVVPALAQAQQIVNVEIDAIARNSDGLSIRVFPQIAPCCPTLTSALSALSDDGPPLATVFIGESFMGVVSGSLNMRNTHFPGGLRIRVESAVPGVAPRECRGVVTLEDVAPINAAEVNVRVDRDKTGTATAILLSCNFNSEIYDTY